MKRHVRTLPLFITMVAMLAFAAPGYGSLVAPVGTNTTVGVPDPAFSWTPVSGADHYVFQLSSGSTFVTPLVSISTKNTQATLTTTVADGPYTWQVRAVDASSNNGPWSSPVNWTKTGTGPTLISPTDGGTVTYPTPVVLKWAPVDGAAQYTVSLSNSSNMSNPTSTDTEGTNFAPPAWLAPGVHYWTVTAKDARGNPVGTSPAGGIGSAFTWVWPSTVSGLGVTSSIDSSAGATAQWTMYDPRFSWNPVSGAVRYQVEVNTDDITWSAASKVCCNDTISTTLTPKTLLPNATYAWRVRAVDASGSVGNWTVGPDFTQSYDSFVTAPPATPSVPDLRMVDNQSDPGTDVDGGTAGYQTQVPIVKWDAVAGASAYDVLMVQYVAGQCQWTTSGVPRWQVRTAATAFTPAGNGWNNLTPWPANGTSVTTDSNGLAPGMSYCVRVTPFRGTASTGGFGSVDVSGDPTFLDPNDDGTAPAFTFTSLPTGNPCTPSCTNGYLGAADYDGPITGTTTGPVPLFTWNPIAGDQSYFVIVARDAAFNTIVDYGFTHIPAYAPRSGASARTYQNQSTHYWWVVLPATGFDGAGAATTPNSGHPQSFDRPQVGPALVSPADSATVSGMPTFTWNPIDGARQYELWVSTDPNFGDAGIIEKVITSDTSYTGFDKAYPSDDLYWQVRAIDYNGLQQPWSASRVYHQTWPTPDLTGMSNPTASDVVPTFSWNPVIGATSYTVQIDQPSNGTTTTTLTSTTLSPTTAYGLGDFKWRVQANFGGAGGNTGGPLTGNQIFTRSIHAPTGLGMIAPSGIAKTPVLFSWNWKAGAKSYNIQVSRDPSFSSSVDSGTTDTTSWASLLQAQDYSNGGQLYWRVQASDSHGQGGTWSAAQSLVFATHLAATSNTSAMPKKTTATIKVTVKDALGHVVPGATIVVSGAGVTKVTKKSASNGTASFKVHPTKAGNITFAVSKAGCVGVKIKTVVF